MSGATGDVRERLAYARDVARDAGREVARRYGEQDYRVKAGDSPVTEADLASNRAIVRALRSRYAGEAILSEESKDPADRLTAWVAARRQ